MPAWTQLPHVVCEPEKLERLVCGAAPPGKSRGGVPDLLGPTIDCLRSKFSLPSVPCNDTKPAQQLLDYYYPGLGNSLCHYVVSPLFESLAQSHERKYYYRPEHALLPYCLFDPLSLPASNGTEADTATIIAIHLASTWAIPQYDLDGWWARFLGDPLSALFNAKYPPFPYPADINLKYLAPALWITTPRGLFTITCEWIGADMHSTYLNSGSEPKY